MQVTSRRLSVPFRYSQFRLAWAGQLINVIGDAISGVTLALYLLPRPDAPEALGLVLGLGSLGGVASLLLGGVLTDRHRASRVIIAADGIRAIGLAGILVLGSSGPRWGLAAFSAVLGVGGGLYRPAYGALMPTLVPAELVAGANAIRSLTNRVAGIVGAGLAGVLVAATSPRSTLVIDLATYAVSIATLIAIRDSRPPAAESSSLVTDARAGVTYVLGRRWMAAVMLQGTVQGVLVLAPVTLLLPLVVGGEGGTWYGVVVAAEAVGAVAGASLGGMLQPAHPGLTATLALLGLLPQFVGIALGVPPWLLAIAAAAAGAGMSVFSVLWLTALQTKVPREYIGRVLSLDLLATHALIPIGLVATGWLLPLTGVAALGWATGALLVITSLGVLPIAGVLDLADRPPPAVRIESCESCP